MLIFIVISLTLLSVAATLSMFIMRKGGSNSRNEKNANADVLRNSGSFLRLGFIVAMAMVVLAFSWTTYDKNNGLLAYELIQDDEIEFDQLPRIKKKKKKIPPAVEISIKKQEVNDDILKGMTFNPSDTTEYEFPNLDIEDEENVDEKDFVYECDRRPSFPGGEDAMIDFFERKMEYPGMANDLGIEGQVRIAFMVNPDGSVSNFKRLTSLGGRCENEAIRVLKRMPRFKPGRIGCKTVAMMDTLIVNYSLIDY